MILDSAAVGILLLIAAAVLGWLLARWGHGNLRDSRFKFVSAEYFKGLNFLLNEQPDKALEVFIRVAEVDSDTVETHFALGNLFRRRGEVDRAIRVHQNLIARPTLTRAHRAQALFELSQDYLRAGLLDRAEGILLELVAVQNYTDRALHSLISLYEQQKDWDQAIAMRHRLQTHTGMSEEETVAQYLCELAQTALIAQDAILARRLLKRAQSHSPLGVRANLLLAQMAEVDEDWALSQQYYQRILEHEIRYATEVLPALTRVTREMEEGDDSLGAFLSEVRRRDPTASAYIAIAAILDSEMDDPVSTVCVNDYLRTEPGLQSLYQMFVSPSDGDHVPPLRDLEPLRIALRSMLSHGPRYRCEECGFRSKTLYWQCPSCKTWNRTMPFHEITFGAVGAVEHSLNGLAAGRPSGNRES